MAQNLRTRIAYEIARREIAEHLGRWTTIKMNKSGKELEIRRTGYGPMEYPERDSHEVVDVETGNVLATGRDLYAVAEFIITCPQTLNW